MKQIFLMIASLRKQFKIGGVPFHFRDPGLLVDNNLQLLLRETHQGDLRRDLAPEYIFDMVSHCDNNTLMGRLSLRIGHTEHIEKYAGHIGYSVELPYRGQRLAARSCLLIAPLARSHGINPLWITCNPQNTASRRTCEIIGAELVETVQIPPNDPLYRWDTKWKCRYRLNP